MSFKPNLSALVGDFDPSTPPPQIAPVPSNVHRPLWSVMIPTYNCAKYLRQTLESVMSQDPGPEKMQIEVVDDCSTKDDPESVVNEIGGGRVNFYRKPKNEGAIPNFNTCIDRSRGHLIHILHGDDYVLPGFYGRTAEMAALHPERVLLATRSFFIDEQCVITGVTQRVSELENGGNQGTVFLTGTPLQFAGIVMRRNFFEKSGGFYPFLVHCADWEMWARAITLGGGVISPEVLACYREFDGNDSSRLVKNAENLRDIARFHLVKAYHQKSYPFEIAFQKLVDQALSQRHRMQASGQIAAAKAAEDIATEIRRNISKPTRNLAWFLDGVGNKFKQWAENLH